MSNSWQLPNKDVCNLIFCMFLGAILLSSFSNALEFGASPPSIVFNLNENERTCKSINIFSSVESIDIRLSDKWSSSKGVKEISKFNKNAENFGILMDYEAETELKGSKSLQICLNASKSGKYYGVLLFDVLDGDIAVGVWITANVAAEKKSVLTGFVSEEGLSFIPESIGNSGKITLILLFNALLFGLLLFLLIRAKREKLSKKKMEL